MHLKPDPVAVEFLRQFGLMFVLVFVGALYFYRSGWPRSRRKHFTKRTHDSSQHKHNDKRRDDE
jgi:hypothetical protein